MKDGSLSRLDLLEGLPWFTKSHWKSLEAMLVSAVHDAAPGRNEAEIHVDQCCLCHRLMTC